MKSNFYIFYRVRQFIDKEWILEELGRYGNRYKLSFESLSDAIQKYNYLYFESCDFDDCDYDIFERTSNGDWMRLCMSYSITNGKVKWDVQKKILI